MGRLPTRTGGVLLSADEIRERYAAIAREREGGADLGLGTGSPVPHAALKPGEVVVDLGSGAGADVLPAARRVGPTGRAIGVDFTVEMLERARRNAAAEGVVNAEFRYGRIESLPLADAEADVVISNCVVNLSADKDATLREARRVLKPGGRLVISDTLRLQGDAPAAAPSCDCESGALSAAEWRAALDRAGFDQVRLEERAPCCDANCTGDACCADSSTGRVLVHARATPSPR